MKVERILEEMNGVRLLGWRLTYEVPPLMVRYLKRMDDETRAAADRELTDLLESLKGKPNDPATE